MHTSEFTIETVINCPPAKVFAILGDLDKLPLWSANISEVRRTSDGPLGVGSTITFVGKSLGRSFESPAECTAYVDDTQFSTKTTSGPFDLEVSYTLEPVDGATRLTTVYQGETKGFFRLAETIAVHLTKKQVETSMETLKELLEADAI